MDFNGQFKSTCVKKMRPIIILKFLKNIKAILVFIILSNYCYIGIALGGLILEFSIY